MTAHIRDLTHLTAAEAAKVLGRSPGAVRALASREGVSMMLPQPRTWRDAVADMSPEDAVDFLAEALDGMIPQSDELGRYMAEPRTARAWAQRAVLERLLATPGHAVSYGALSLWCYGLAPAVAGSNENIKGVVQLLRSALRAGVEIRNHYGFGYSIHIDEDAMSKTPEQATSVSKSPLRT